MHGPLQRKSAMEPKSVFSALMRHSISRKSRTVRNHHRRYRMEEGYDSAREERQQKTERSDRGDT
jgi:hypothetical protein